jgi:hypothetical protein
MVVGNEEKLFEALGNNCREMQCSPSCFRNDHFLLVKLENHVFHKNLKDFFHLFLGATFENTLLVNDMPHKSMYNPPFSAIFFDIFYRSHNNSNYLLKTILPYLESLHLFGMWVYKFVKLNPFDNIMDMLLVDLRYAN